MAKGYRRLGSARYARHTRGGYALPASKSLFVVASSLAPRAGLRKARPAGVAPS